MKRAPWLWVKVTFGLAVLALVFSRVHLGKAAGLLLEASPGWLAAAVFCLVLGVLLQGVRWKLILDLAGLPVALGRLCRVNLVGTFFSSFLPGAVTGDVAKTLYAFERGNRTSVLTTTLLSRLVGAAATFGVGLAALPFAPDELTEESWWLSCSSALLMATVVSALVLSPWVGQASARIVRALPVPARLQDLAEQGFRAVGLWHGRPASVVLTVVAAVLYQFVGFVLVGYFSARALGLDLPLAGLAIIASLAGMAMMLPISINGLGVAEGAYVFLFMALGVASEEALSLALLFRLWNLSQAAVGGLVYVSLERRTGAALGGVGYSTSQVAGTKARNASGK